MQVEVEDVYARLEKLVGDQLTVTSVHNIAYVSPIEELWEQAQAWPKLTGLEKPEHLPVVQPGVLRPVFGSYGIDSHDHVGAQLLMYVQSVVEDAGERLFPFAGVTYSENDYEEEKRYRDQVHARITWLMNMKPFIEQDAILFTRKWRGFWDEEVMGEWMTLPAGEVTELPEKSKIDFWLRPNILIAKERAGTCLALSDDEQEAYLRHLSSQQTSGERAAALLRPLGKVQLHELPQSLSELAKLRNDDLFQTWRTGLRNALQYVEDGWESEDIATHVYNEMSGSLKHFEKKAASKNWFRKAKDQSFEFGVSAPGVIASASVGAVAGGPHYALFAAAAGWSVNAAIKTLQKTKEEKKLVRQSQTVSDLLLTFKAASR